MLKENALVGMWVEKSESSKVLNATFAVIGGVILLSLLAQIAIPLPFTPVPITGQSFGVMLVSLLWGRKWGFSTVVAYVSLGFVGLPLFAQGASGLKLLTSGYLIGMCVASMLVGSLADRGWNKKFSTSLAACLLGSCCVFGFGLLVLGQFVPAKVLLAQGLLPFLPGDLIKSSLASLISVKFTAKLDHSKSN